MYKRRNEFGYDDNYNNNDDKDDDHAEDGICVEKCYQCHKQLQCSMISKCKLNCYCYTKDQIQGC